MTFAVVLLFSMPSVAQVNIRLQDNTVFCVCEQVKDSLYVFLGNIPRQNRHMYGHHKRSGDTLFFTPIVPFQFGTEYLAICGQKKKTFTKAIPDDYEYAKVLSIYPTHKKLPENALKFYLKFSKSMSSKAYEFIRLVDVNGTEVERGLLKEIPELWNEDYTELTVWVEPGRIKRGLGPNEKLGPVMKAGEKYTLLISPEILDRNGVKAENVLSKTFVVGEADRISPKIEDWKVEQVSSDGKARLKIIFDEALDFGSGSEAFYLPGIQGEWSMLPSEKSILFIPEESLAAGKYTIEVDHKVEDLAGNNLMRLFDADLENVSKTMKKRFKIKFVVK